MIFRCKMHWSEYVHQIDNQLTCVNLSSLRRLASSKSAGERGRYFSRSAGDTELRYIRKMNNFRIFANKIYPKQCNKYDRNVCICCVIYIALTNRSSADGPTNGLISSLCNSCGTLSNACGPCGNPIGPANAPNGPASVGIGCGGVIGICWACICCQNLLKERRKEKQHYLIKIVDIDCNMNDESVAHNIFYLYLNDKLLRAHPHGRIFIHIYLYQVLLHTYILDIYMRMKMGL